MKITKRLFAILLLSALTVLQFSGCKSENKSNTNDEDTEKLAEFKNNEFKNLVSDALNKDAAELTVDDLNQISGLDVYYYAERIENTMQYRDVCSVTVKKEGFNEVADKYYDTPKEERDGLESPENYYANILIDKFEAYEDIKLLSGLTEISLNSEYMIFNEDPVKYFKNLTGLRNISISNYVIPNLNDISRFIDLQSLSISINQKQIPDGMEIEYIKDLSPLANLTKLESLSLSGNLISDLTPITSLDNLKSLSVTHSALSDISPVALMHNLESVDFYFNSIENVAPLVAIPGLKHINLDYNYIQDISPFADLDPNVVEYVSIDMNGIQDDEPLKKLGKQKVYLGYEPNWEE